MSLNYYAVNIAFWLIRLTDRVHFVINLLHFIGILHVYNYKQNIEIMFDCYSRALWGVWELEDGEGRSSNLRAVTPLCYYNYGLDYK